MHSVTQTIQGICPQNPWNLFFTDQPTENRDFSAEKRKKSTLSKQKAKYNHPQHRAGGGSMLSPTDRFHFLHIDLNSFFASVEQQLHPEYRNRPLAVVPTHADTTCCIAASYEAKV